MIEIRFLPGRFLVAIRAILAQGALMMIVLLMAAETILRSISMFFTGRMAGVAGHAQARVRVVQGKVCPVVFEGGFIQAGDNKRPAHMVGMAGFTILARNGHDLAVQTLMHL